MEGLDYICKTKDDLSFFTETLGSKEGNVNVRTNIFSAEEFESFLKTVKGSAKVNFVVYQSTLPNLKRFVWSKTYQCHHSGQSVKKDMGCKLRLRVRIKKLTWSVRYKDKDIESFPCLISIIGSHSHDMLLQKTLRALPVLSPTKKILEEDFSEDNTWEPKANLDCPELIEEFEENLAKSGEKVEETKDEPIAATVPKVPRKTGFDRGLKPHRILGATDNSGELMFLMKWEGTDVADMVRAADANEKCPKTVIQFYEQRLTWSTPKPADEKKAPASAGGEN